MSASNPFLRFIAIRLGVATVLLYAVQALPPGQAQAPTNPQAAPAMLVAPGDRFEQSKPIGNRDSEVGELLREMSLHD